MTVWCEVCDGQVDAADPEGTGPDLCAVCDDRAGYDEAAV